MKLIEDNLDTTIGYLKCLRDIENTGNPKRHPDTNKELKIKKKVDVVNILVDLVKHGDRKDGEDSFWIPLYEFAMECPEHKKALVEYLITYDTLPFIGWYPVNKEESKKLDDLLSKVEDKEIKVCLDCARYWFSQMLSGRPALLMGFRDIILPFIK